MKKSAFFRLLPYLRASRGMLILALVSAFASLSISST